MSRKPIPLPVPVEEPAEDCPKCPPKGAPAWMATFADIATLLMAFFVLILSFAEFNQPKFKMVAGSLKNSFGVQREVPVFEQPQGTTMLDLKFSPSPEMSVTEELTQDTTETEQPEIDRPVTEDDGKGAAEGENGDGGDKAAEEAQQVLAEAIRDALQGGTVQVETRDGEVVMTFDTPAAEQLPEQLSEAAKALDGAAEATGQSTAEVLLEGLAEAMPDLARATQTEAETQRAERSAAIAEAELRVALRQEISQGLVSVEQRKDRVIVTVGAGGAFPSGEADLTEEARDVMTRLAFAAMGEASDIEVTGHTDSVPLSPYSPYRDNWGLAAARASSVVRELSGSGLVAPERLRAVGRGESMPVADNATDAGREKNRRIEIEITY
ncbi:MAG: OmpA family protein [Roseovarius sp.]|uniref:OmpA family protein n=1 Tax=Roseovarius sp. TaxID=1486281 RepID=UPI0032EC40FB